MMALGGLMKEQRDHLVAFVDAHHRVGSERRAPFLIAHTVGNDPRPNVIHEGLPNDYRAADGDLEELQRAGFISIERDGRYTSFRITNDGIRSAQQLVRANAASIEAVEVEPQRYIRTDVFASRYREAHAKWLDAERALTAAGDAPQLSTVGHLCREAMQAFASTLCNLTSTAPSDQDPARTVARIRACIAGKRSTLGAALTEFLDALLVYWGTVSDLVQRQEHGASKDGPPLTMEDGRRVLFHTAIVMYELDRALVQ